jgi:16S rRNA (guanine527-N7)-methyltransferase
MDSATIERLLRPYAKLDEQRLRLISTYIDILLKWNARVNLTAVRDPEEIVTRHFGESFFAAEVLRSGSVPASAIDLGSGAGFPGIPLAIHMTGTTVTLVESNHKKSTFLREVITALKLKNAAVYAGRGEDYSGQAELVTMRAVERFDKALPVAISLAVPGGRVGLMIGSGQIAHARALAPEIDWKEPEPVPGGHSRALLVGVKRVKVE